MGNKIEMSRGSRGVGRKVWEDVKIWLVFGEEYVERWGVVYI